jgi:hypothetical protein
MVERIGKQKKKKVCFFRSGFAGTANFSRRKAVGKLFFGRRVSMSFEILTIPLSSDKGLFNCDDLNRFCANKKVISSRTEFFNVNGKTYWSIFLEYDTLLETATFAV